MTFVIVTSSVHERELHSMCAPARALSRIVLSLTKPNDKISPTKNDNIKKILTQYYNIRVVMVKVLDCIIVVREFELPCCYYVPFRTKTLRKGMKPLIYGVKRSTIVFQKGGIWHLITREDWHGIKYQTYKCITMSQTNRLTTVPRGLSSSVCVCVCKSMTVCVAVSSSIF